MFPCVCRNAQKSEEAPDLPEPEFQTVVSWPIGACHGSIMAQVEILGTHVKTRWILWPVINPVSKWLARTVKMVYSGLCKRPHLDISREELLKEIISLPHWATLMCTHMHTYMTIYTVHNSICNKQCKVHSCNYSFSNIMQQQFKQYLHCLRCYKSLRGDLKNMGRCVWILRKSYVILTENI